MFQTSKIKRVRESVWVHLVYSLEGPGLSVVFSPEEKSFLMDGRKLCLARLRSCHAPLRPLRIEAVDLQAQVHVTVVAVGRLFKRSGASGG